MRRTALIASLGLLLGSCAALDTMVPITDPNTGQVTEVPLGNIAADVLEASGGTASTAVGEVVGAATANPVVGAGAGAALLALVSAGAGALRRKRPAVAPTQPEQPS